MEAAKRFRCRHGWLSTWLSGFGRACCTLVNLALCRRGSWRRSGRLCLHLPASHVRLDQQARTLGGERHHLSTTQSSIPVRVLIVTFRVSERVGLPCEECDSVA